jgi:hypothetical protein
MYSITLCLKACGVLLATVQEESNAALNRFNGLQLGPNQLKVGRPKTSGPGAPSGGAGALLGLGGMLGAQDILGALSLPISSSAGLGLGGSGVGAVGGLGLGGPSAVGLGGSSASAGNGTLSNVIMLQNLPTGV